jgi:heme/copper-type cytochrome/quinol oxidase subunit 4|tara:strand:+ start:258 stop:578 length:321 start_codon:yes stop_codon:yes gene_type:complete
MKRIKDELLATNLEKSKKKWLFIIVIIFSIFPFFISYKAFINDLTNLAWQFRHFLGIALVQAIAQLAISWYVLKNELPNYVIYSFIISVILFQTIYGILIILLANA